ncbi:MAG: DUF1190 domain-containing protein [Methylobacteriaceae bacterium]|nr:DUF1190 domain-containing protein [Methylobacteriaceae bacterium]
MTMPRCEAPIRAALALCAGVAASCVAMGESVAAPRGRYVYVSVGACMAAGRLPLAWCENAAANARAAFEEAAPRHATRAACEKAHGAGRCLPAATGDGRGFAPRQGGFVITVTGAREASVEPGARGVAAKPRSVLTRDVSVAGRKETREDAAREEAAGEAESEAPRRPFGKLPPPVRFDPNFDCASVLEPGARGGSPGCYPAPARRR